MHKKDAEELLKKYREGICTEEEKAWLDAWYLTYRHKGAAELSEDDYDLAEKAIWNNINPANSPPIRRIMWPSVAAAIVLFTIGIGFFHRQKNTSSTITKAQAVVIKPGGNKAILTLSNGKKVVLDDNDQDKITGQPGVTISKSTKGKIVYQLALATSDQNVPDPSIVKFNTIATPRGGQYQVNLPDGTQIWLNASSSLTYPVKFTGTERKVTLTGEAYFEVAKNKDMPFKVQVNNNVNVEVLGTHFNIMSYPEEQTINTTLLEGSIKISKGDTKKIIKPGQQAVTAADNSNIAVTDVDVEEAVAWKNGNFNFNGVDIQSIMRKLCRWYDIEVVYQGKIPSNKFVGTIPRSSDIGEIIKVLELNHIHVKVQDKKITIGS